MVIVDLKELVHVILIVKRTGIVILINIHVHVILTVLQMIRALTYVDVIIIVHVIHKL